MIYDLAILGGGPAGVAAGVYAARKKINTVFLTPDFGGQSIVSPGIENWIGTKNISGEDLANQLKEHLFAYQGQGLEIRAGERVTKINKTADGFEVATEKNNYQTKTVLITTGAHRRKLTIPGADTFEQKGITYCATCDGPLFSGRNVIVIGGGNAAFESALQLLAYCQSVTIIHHSAEFKADPITVEKVLANPKAKVIKNAETMEIKGSKFANALVYKDKITGETHELATGGIFVEIGFIPTTEFAKDLINLNPYGSIVVDPKNQRASLTGIWAAGDCTNGLYHQNNIAAGDAIKALEDIYIYLQTGK